MSGDANPFESLQEQIDDAAAYMDVSEDVLTIRGNNLGATDFELADVLLAP